MFNPTLEWQFKIVMNAKEMTLATWECPICGLENTDFLIKDQLLSDELQCSFCDHESGLIKWLF